MPIRFVLLLLLTAVGALHPSAQAASGDAPFTDAQRRQIVEVLRDALRHDPSILRDAMAAMQADDQRIQDQNGSAAIARVRDRLITPSDPVAGNPFGTATLVVFYDTRCPYCRQLLPVLTELLRTDPNVRIVFKDLPILGPSSVLESRALMAAQMQGSYFKLQPVLMQNTAPANRDTLRADADRAGLDGGLVVRNMDDPTIKTRLDANMALANELGLQGTPAIIAGTHLIPGAMDIGDLRKLVADVRAGN